MRTVTFLGLMIIGGALRNISEMQKLGYETFFAIIFICCMVMDIAEFIKKMTDDQYYTQRIRLRLFADRVEIN